MQWPKKLGLALIGLAMSVGSGVAWGQTNRAEIHLVTPMKNIGVSVTHNESAKRGACRSGFSWMSRFSGCTKQETETGTDSMACPSGYTGTQTRTKSRQKYTIQHNNSVQYDPWNYGSWNSSGCQYIPPPVSEPDPDTGGPGKPPVQPPPPPQPPSSLTELSLSEYEAVVRRSQVRTMAQGLTNCGGYPGLRPFQSPSCGSQVVSYLIYDPVYQRLYCHMEWWPTTNEGMGYDAMSHTGMILGNHAMDMMSAHGSCSTNGTSGTVWGTCISKSVGDADMCQSGARHYP